LAFSPNGQQIVVSCCEGEANVWDVTTRQTLFTLGRGVRSVAFSPDGERIATACGFTIKLWDATTSEEVFTLRGHAGVVLSVAFSPDGRKLASGSIDRTATIWDATPVLP
jgi:WD40 repeat protein